MQKFGDNLLMFKIFHNFVGYILLLAEILHFLMYDINLSIYLCLL